jgi:hypothetical protein
MHQSLEYERANQIGLQQSLKFVARWKQSLECERANQIELQQSLKFVARW